MISIVVVAHLLLPGWFKRFIVLDFANFHLINFLQSSLLLLAA